MTTQSANPIRLRTPAEVVDAVPYLLGFRPENSLVMVSLGGERKRIGFTARTDLPEVRHARECARQLVVHLKREKARGVSLLFYPPADGPSHPSVCALAEAFRQRLDRAGIKLHEMLCVYDDRWWSLLCTNTECCPAEGTPVQNGETSLCAVATAINGRVVFDSRAQVERTIGPVGGLARAAMEQALARVDDALTYRVRAGEHTAVAAESLDLFRAQVEHRLTPRGRGAVLAIDDAARLIVGLDDIHVRDEILLWHEGERGNAARALFVALARHAVPPWETPTLTVLAWFAYVQGEGALANIAIVRARAADPDYALAQILDDVITAALNPSVLRSALRAPEPRPIGDSKSPIG